MYKSFNSLYYQLVTKAVQDPLCNILLKTFLHTHELNTVIIFNLQRNGSGFYCVLFYFSIVGLMKNSIHSIKLAMRKKLRNFISGSFLNRILRVKYQLNKSIVVYQHRI